MTLPGLGIAKGMALTFVRMLQRKPTIQYPEVTPEVSPRHRGRLVLLFDEAGALKCETCFQCAQACPIECIDMGGVDTRQRFHVHWGPAEQYAERREESAPRRAGRTVPDPAFEPFQRLDTRVLDPILHANGHDPAHLLDILAEAQDTFGYLPVAALKHISHRTGASYAMVYGAATFYGQLRMEQPGGHVVAICRCPSCAFRGAGQVTAALETALETHVGRPSPDGRVRLEAADCHGAAPSGIFLTVDGQPQAKVDPASAASLATRLRAAPVGAGAGAS
ncbi:MAG TPA: NAD(P)H-dependent oxidoreductase subunit E [Candidatus Limnocylindrales bacterium]|nr:NAD(P)H-dependent oxidoreductase subunit E [Candidatus Limnocylindrales bacterium]